MAPCTAFSKSASSKTIKGAFPPNSKDSFLRVEEEWAINCFPTSVLPVKDIFLIRVSSQSLVPIAEDFEEVTIFNSPWFNPACRANSPKAKAVNGVC